MDVITLLAPLSRTNQARLPAVEPLGRGKLRRHRDRWCRPLLDFILTLSAVTLVLGLALAMKIIVYGWSHDHDALMVELARLLRP